MHTSTQTTIISAIAFGAFVAAPAFAGAPSDVYPRVQSAKELRLAPVPATALAPASVEKFPALAAALRSRGTAPAGTLEIDARLADEIDDLPSVRGAYALAVSPEKIEIRARDDDGIFYATQTLAQMIEKDGALQPCVVRDFPDVPFRGSIEGFYGKPWEHERRLSQIRFYGKYKMNAYIYGPKDDPYSGFNSNSWREEYPAEQAKQIAELVAASRENHVDFIWALHPGATIRWGDSDGDGVPDDVIAALKKFEAMYALGVRAFAVFFDDIGGEGAKAEKQAEMLNFLNREFIKKKPDVAPLLMCPTDYAGTHGSDYKKTLGEKLDADVNVMWTGPSICADVPAPAVEAVSEHFRRAPFIWWNWPVDDYCRTHLLLGRTYGLDKANKGKLAGFASNPMDKPEASKIALFGVADWTWNIDAFDSEENWNAAFPRLYPQKGIAEAMKIFATHNSDQGKNGHGYRREESEAFGPVAEEILKEYRETGTLSEKNAKRVRREFGKIRESAAVLKDGANLPNLGIVPGLPEADPALWHEIEYWVKSFEKLGKIGLCAELLIEKPTRTDARKAAIFRNVAVLSTWQQTYFEAQKKRHREETFPSDKQWATGCRVATKVLTPLADELVAGEWKKFCESFGEKAHSPQGEYKAFTNVDALGDLQAERSGIYVTLKRILEVVRLAPAQFIGLELPEGVPATYVHVKLDDAEAAKKCRIEISTDGETWEDFDAHTHEGELQKAVDPNAGVRFFRLVNKSPAPVEFRINQLKFDVPEDSKANTRGAMTDGDLFSFYTLTETETFTADEGGVIYVITDVGCRQPEPNSVTVPASPDAPARVFEILKK
ncbi:beta-N-acetylglucosaminidase domain-containing protein [Candidatus Spyradosoma sp. SGI.093]|uniref:beta-N-acetylglucosaminidase domain-containing protein n=1 Tax=Candidatus Spyradosoma sp. SGI.093 TaxID=3420583 RepID=UPI003CFC68FF